MKKLLLSAAAILAASSLWALGPRVFTGEACVGISPDGKYSVSTIAGTLTIIDNETGELTTFEGDDLDDYGLGYGNAISQDNIMVGFHANLPVYFKDGQWRTLNTAYPENVNIAHGICADGSRICGIIGPTALSLDADAPMSLPVIWERLEDGTYSDPIILPHPEKDYTGRIPQAITAMSISNDGKTIVGQMVDYSGMMTTMIYYTLNENGTWEYNNVFEKLANPEGKTVPTDPGDGPTEPSILDFMTEDEKNAYQTAYDAWEESGYTGDAPLATDYATAEEKAQYNAALAVYNKEYPKWWDEYVAFITGIAALNGQTIMYNNLRLTGDGKTAYSTAQILTEDDSWEGVSKNYAPVSFSLADGNYTIYEGDYNVMSAIADNNTVVCYRETDMEPRSTVLYLNGDTKDPVSLMDYMKQHNEDLYNWMDRNLVYDYTGLEWNDETEQYDEVLVQDFAFTGESHCTPDMKVFVCSTTNYWNPFGAQYYSYLLPEDWNSGINETGFDGSEMKIMALKGGILDIRGEACDVRVYGTDGTLLFSADNANGLINTGLSTGIYVVTANGSRTLKVAF